MFERTSALIGLDNSMMMRRFFNLFCLNSNGLKGFRISEVPNCDVLFFTGENGENKIRKRANDLVANANVLFKNLYRGLGATPKHW